MAAPITDITAREILDSRGNPTPLVTVSTARSSGSFAVPAGASTGTHEATDRRDGGTRFSGMGVSGAIEAVRGEIRETLIGKDVFDQAGIDRAMIELDGTPTKSRLGGNATIGVSIAAARAAAATAGSELYEYLPSLAPIAPSRAAPFLYMNLMNGGKHAASPLAFQEYHVVPDTEYLPEAIEMGTAIMHALKKRVVAELGAASANVGDEGGFVPDTADVVRPLELLAATVEDLGMSGKVSFALDVAASSFYEDGRYRVGADMLSEAELAAIYRTITERFPIRSIEDPFEEEDFASFATLVGGDALIVGDDLTVTNAARLQKAIDEQSVTALIVKPNQVGTLTETLECMLLARRSGIECIVSHRSGETDDTFVSDLAYAFGCYGIKAGAPQRGERVAKYNRLWDIQEHR